MGTSWMSPVFRVPSFPDPRRKIGRVRRPSLSQNVRKLLFNLSLVQMLLQMLRYRFSHRLLVFAATTLLVDGVGPEHFARTRLNQLNRDVAFVFDPRTIRKKATCNLAAC